MSDYEDLRILALIKAQRLGLNKHQIKTILEGMPAWVNIFLDDTKVVTYQDAVDKVIIPFNLMKFDYDIIKRIDAGGHTVMCVAGEEGFAYTIGRTNNCPLPHELYLSVGIGTTAQTILNELVAKYPDGNYPETPIALETAFVKVGRFKSPSRVQIVKAKNPAKIIEDNFRRIDKWTGLYPNDIFIVYIGDANNLLPGEPRYDETFKQYMEPVENQPEQDNDRFN